MRPEPAFDALAARDRAAIEERLGECVRRLASDHAGMREAIEYSLLGGGKRLRGLLCLWTHDALAGTRRGAALDAGCAVECVHAYSLVHDDLPCMDDDDLRRGKPSSHRRFGEATAVLAGDALLNLGYEILAAPGEAAPADTLELMRVLVSAAGTGGLISGQALDMAPPASDAATVDRIHEFKTARLIAAAMEMGAVAAGAAPDARARVRRAGLLAGSAFQITDDLLDVEGSEESLGKTPRKDVHGGKVTFPSVVGIAEARRVARERIGEALAALPEARGRPLAALFSFVTGRAS
jgi:geranylgeranyl pyrophosphate synthase